MKWVLSVMFAMGVAGAACNGTTGDNLIQFTPYAAGVAGAQQPFDAFGWRIQLTSASMYIGAVYFDESPPQTSFDSTECNVSDTFAAQVPGGVQVNLLSTTPQEFSVFGSGSADRALSWDLWFTDGDINQPNALPTATLTGYATLISDPTEVVSFGAIVNINPGEDGAGARGMPASDPALPGAYPICKQRIVQIGGIDVQFGQTNQSVNGINGALLVTVDPRAWFLAAGQIDFSQLNPYNDPAACQLGSDDWNDAYESWGHCGPDMTCPMGQACNPYAQNGVPICVTPCNMNVSEAMACPDGFTCNFTDGNCIAAVCIPDSNWVGCPATTADAGATKCPVSSVSAQAGENLYLGILEGGGAAYKAYFSASGELP